VPIDEPSPERLRALWRKPCSFTAFVPIAGARQSELDQRLRSLGPSLEAALAGAADLHTLRLVALPAGAPGGPARVLFNSVRDSSLGVHLNILIAAAGPLLAEALAGADFPGAPGDIPALLMRCRVTEMTVHLGAINASVADILSERKLLEEIQGQMDEAVRLGRWPPGTSAEAIRQELMAHVLSLPQGLDLPRGARAPLSWIGRGLRFVDLVTTFAFPAIGVLAQDIQNAIKRIADPRVRRVAWLGYGLWWIYGGLFTAAAFLLVRLLECIEPDPVAPSPDPTKVAQLEATEDLTVINEVTYWFPVKPTLIRRLLLRVILWGSERGCRHFWTNGSLSGINTIHYARIIEVDGGTTLLFMSDYDGSLDRYLIDFLGVGSNAVIPIASNAHGCPKTHWLFNPADPATFGPRLKSLLRLDQLGTAVWYRAYPNLTVDDTLKGMDIRNGLFAAHMSEREAADWLANF
jgi:hypothetical protein